MNAPQANDPVILPWAEMSKKAEREGVDIMDYVNSMHAHVLNQRDQLARQNKVIGRLSDEAATMRQYLNEGREALGSFEARQSEKWLSELDTFLTALKDVAP